MICKDCFHYELCNDFVFGGGIELSNADKCRHFKDKSLFLKLPCKMGDEIYEAIFFKKGVFSHWVGSKVVGFHIGDFPTLRGQKRKQYVVVWHSFPNCICHVPLDNFGKTVFFKHELEEAEKALKARQCNEQ